MISVVTDQLIRRQFTRGISLIELMVALVIGSLLIVGAVTVYMQSRNTYRTSDTAARLQEVARYAMDTIEPDVRMAGFWGLNNRADFVENRGASGDTQQPVDGDVGSNCGNNWAVDAVAHIDGRDAASTGGTGYDLTCAGTNPVNWADVLVVRRASGTTTAATAGRMQIQSNRLRGVIFDDGVIPAGFSVAPASETRDLFVHAYYISEILPSPNGVRQFALRRQTLIGGASPAIRDDEIIPGVQDLQVQFGIDANNDGNTDQYVNPNEVAGRRVASVRLWLMVIAEAREIGFTNDATYAYANANYGSFDDDRRRVVINKTIQIRNTPL